MSKIFEPKTIRNIISEPLEIPNYQRPYRWTKSNVEKLIMDIEHDLESMKDAESDYRYRIGSIILHRDKNDKSENIVNVVDGQQRLLTICIILFVLGQNGCCLIDKEFENRDTLDNIRHNFDFINTYFKGMADEKKVSFKEYLLDRCEMIIIEADDIAEAFQMFDSQNARGKKLEPADLLKAYHLRSMSDENEKRMCVQRWEDAIDKGLLHYVMSEIIYRSRCWTRKDYNKHYFNNNTIDEFKGIDIDIFSKSRTLYPYMQHVFFASQVNFYRIDEPIVNGRRFFDYIDHYIGLFEHLFPRSNDYAMYSDNDNEIQQQIRERCFYGKMRRTGDERIRNVVYCQMLAFFDKFGDANIKEFLDLIYNHNYHIRLHSTQIRYETIHNELLNKENPFEWISESYYPDISKLRILLPFYEDKIDRTMLDKNAHEFSKTTIN